MPGLNPDATCASARLQTQAAASFQYAITATIRIPILQITALEIILLGTLTIFHAQAINALHLYNNKQSKIVLAITEYAKALHVSALTVILAAAFIRAAMIVLPVMEPARAAHVHAVQLLQAVEIILHAQTADLIRCVIALVACGI